eukprot:s205_g44.t1
MAMRSTVQGRHPVVSKWLWEKKTLCFVRLCALVAPHVARDYTAAITALGRLGDWNEAISLYSEYAARQADNFQVPDDICHTSVVSACERGSQWATCSEQPMQKCQARLSRL